MKTKTDFRPYLIRLFVVFLISLVIVIVISEGAHFLQNDQNDRAPKTVQLVIPSGTADRVAAGESAPGIPQDMVFVLGDVLEVKNEDKVPHQLGPVWVPPGATGSLVLENANKYSFTCSFVPSHYLGLDVRQGTTLAVRMTAILFATPTTTAFFFIYSLLVFPVKPRQKTVAVETGS